MKRRRVRPLLAASSVALAALILSGCADRAATQAEGSGDGPVGQATSALLTGSTCVIGQQCQSAEALATIQHGGAGDIFDSGLNDDGVSSNEGSGTTSGTIPIGDGVGASPTARQELMNFNLSPITSLNGAGYTVVGSQLALYFCPNAANQTINVHQALAPWSETTVSWVSFNEQFVATPFTSFSAGPLNAFSPISGCTGTVPPNTTRIDMTAMVSGWLNGTLAQDGILMEQPPVTDVETVVLSTRFPVKSAANPMLFVTFNVLCEAGTADCDNDGLDGCEVNITTTQNCGACGNVCPIPANASATCDSGVCGFSCNAGYADCNGVCMNVETDPNNCGTCGDVCPTPANGSPTCAGGMCGISCDAGYADCNGVCMNIETDPNNCGACGDVCPTPANGSPTCGGGACGVACNAGFTNCSGVCDDDSTDVNNCGACGNVCPARNTCQNGACVPAACTAATENSNCNVSLTNSGGTSGACASGFGSGSCSYSCTNGVWTEVSDTCAPASCTAATESGNCNVNATTSGGTSGTCASGFGAGSCSYSCTNGVWTEVSDTCAPASCTAATESGNCTVSLTTSGGTSGTCVSGDTGSCSYACSNGVWTQVSDTCALGCSIGGTTYAAGAVNPSDSCQACLPTLSTTAYSNVPAGGDTTTCLASSGDVCNGSGSCVSECFIGGALVASGTLNPNNGCQECIPTTSTTSYSAVANNTNTSACLASAGDVCQGGNCVCNSTGGLVNCSGVCVSESNNPDNCGACGHVCAEGQVCASGVCSLAFTTSKIAVGATFACAVVNGDVYCWGATSQYGDNDAYLGDGSTSGSTTPVQVTGITSAVSVFAAAYNACALLSNGTVQCWGDNASGQLGDGTTTNRTSPVAVSGLTKAVAVAGNTQSPTAEISFSCAVLSTGGVECWGDNSYGELGNGTTTNSPTPVSVSGLSNAVAIAAGSDFACALQEGGTVACWGDGTGGALGNEVSSGNFSTPVAVEGVTNAVGIAAMYESACAVLSNGDVKCWGYGGCDALGDGSTNDSLTPVTVSSLTNATAIVASDGDCVSTVCAANTAGGAVCWGNNTSGQLGDGNSNSSDVPVTVTGLSGAVQIAVGGGAGTGQGSACALLSDGAVECWGSNAYGQLGDGTNNNSLTPVTVIDL